MSVHAKAVSFDVIGTTFSLEPVRAALVQLGESLLDVARAIVG